MTVAKRRGSRFEADVVAYLAEHGFPLAERRVMGGARDRGDVAGIPGWTLELKAERTLDLAGALREAKVEAANAGTLDCAAVLKRRNRPIAEPVSGAGALFPAALLRAVGRGRRAGTVPRCRLISPAMQGPGRPITGVLGVPRGMQWLS